MYNSTALGDEEEAEDRYFLRGFDRIEAKSAARANVAKRNRYLRAAGIIAGCVVAAAILITIIVTAARQHALPWACPTDSAQYDTTLFVIGDWGRRGNAHQMTAALMMSDVAKCMKPEIIISTGDNFYENGLNSANDDTFVATFGSMYKQDSLKDVPWYAVLGNHDYGDGIDPSNSACAANSLDKCPVDCCYSPVWQFTGRQASNDARWHCQNGTYTVQAGKGLVELLLIDTPPFIQRYQTAAWGANAGGIRSQHPNITKAEINAKLVASTAKWKLAVGHHPMMSYGRHCNYNLQGDCLDMAWLQQPLKDAGVAAYFAGHDHDLQFVQPDDSTPGALAHVLSGAGSDVRNNEFTARSDWPQQLKFVADDQGIVAARANATHLVLHFYTSSKSFPSYTAVLLPSPPTVGG